MEESMTFDFGDYDKPNEVTLVPSRLHPLTLSNLARYSTGWGEEADAKRDKLMGLYIQKTLAALDVAFGTTHLDGKLTPEEKRGRREQLGRIKTLWQENIDHIASELAKRARIPKEKRKLMDPQEARELEKSLFNHYLLNRARAYVRRVGPKVLSDLDLTRDALEDSRRFGELEALCEGPLRGFGRTWIPGFGEEDLLQEGRMVILQCASKYEGRRFARFKTMVRKALDNKKKDLIRYTHAQKRKAWRRTHTAGLGDEDSWLAERLADAVARNKDEPFGENLGTPGVYSAYGISEGFATSTSRFSDLVYVEGGEFGPPGEELDDTTRPVGVEIGTRLRTHGEYVEAHGPEEEAQAYEKWLEEVDEKAWQNNPQITKPPYWSKTARKQREAQRAKQTVTSADDGFLF